MATTAPCRCRPPPGVPATVRASFGLYNTVADADALVDGLHFALRELKLG